MRTAQLGYGLIHVIPGGQITACELSFELGHLIVDIAGARVYRCADRNQHLEPTRTGTTAPTLGPEQLFAALIQLALGLERMSYTNVGMSDR